MFSDFEKTKYKKRIKKVGKLPFDFHIILSKFLRSSAYLKHEKSKIYKILHFYEFLEFFNGFKN